MAEAQDINSDSDVQVIDDEDDHDEVNGALV